MPPATAPAPTQFAVSSFPRTVSRPYSVAMCVVVSGIEGLKVTSLVTLQKLVK